MVKGFRKMVEGYIYDWVKDNFGEQEANEPSWNIEALAAEIARHSHDLYTYIETEYVREDVKYVAEDYMETTLNKEQLEYAVSEYMDCDGYRSMSDEKIEDMKYFIEEAKKNIK